MDYSSKNYTTFLILPHLVFVYTDQKKRLNSDEDAKKALFEEIAVVSNCSLAPVKQRVQAV
ncbi:hypothetical protein KTT_39270 [Tengunoibacter tsumagoiensis]|uniref:Uncharacterized protein n=1 Tax=Tengunoibacter tsumagoiensis TaxID=2014871 RepID=A0A402A4K0_9CHLR|nr:hypothetical protein KTT_39270 [Tengunoibacter tsumagoiensis]